MSDVLELWIDRIDTPIGEMILIADRDGNLRATDWTNHEPRMHNFLRRHYGKEGFTLTPTRNSGGLPLAIRNYFAGDLTAIDNLPVKTNGTPFQRQVWQTLREIPPGTTISYGDLAKRIGRSAAVRAVGLANGSNPIGVIVPCHRVIGSNGSLTGYGGGMERKRWLLEHEGAMTPSIAPFAMVGEASGAHLTWKRAASPRDERQKLERRS
jgi:methylated-DNA-[protein]-cysteine S-methyltransferase